ncbi:MULTISPECIES: hypothetical protein [Chryseobacterium]|uniref:hypothetical protein n=1 Tax=Chryseobacterium sp. R2A-55 TaxID=2744445 RepID=UPI001F2767AF|nr:hypothetical protein [Chryseobacterium sp. R2A-55]
MIKVGFLLSYDYQYIFTALDEIYQEADLIVMSYDVDRKTWAGNYVEIPESFFDEVRKYDVANKIKFYGDHFFVPGHTAMELETRQRNMMAKVMGKGGWHIQIDSDEYAYDFKKLVYFLRKNSFLLRNPTKTPATFLVNFVTQFKRDNDGFYVITPYREACYLVTNTPEYVKARVTNSDKNYFLNYNLIHQSWARSEEEILQKIKNWGHKDDFKVDDFFEKWKNLSKENFHLYSDFHPLDGKSWSRIEFVGSSNIQEFIEVFQEEHPQMEIFNPWSRTKRLKLFLKSLF